MVATAIDSPAIVEYDSVYIAHGVYELKSREGACPLCWCEKIGMLFFFIKDIIAPYIDIIFNVFHNPIPVVYVSDRMIMKARLPFE